MHNRVAAVNPAAAESRAIPVLGLPSARFAFMPDRPVPMRAARPGLAGLALLSATLFVVSSPAAAARAAPPADAADLAACDSLVATYLAAVVAGDTVAASSCWRASDVAGAARLGTACRDLPLKVDGDSPLWWARPRTPAVAPPSRRHAPVAAADGTVTVALVVGDRADTTRFVYHLARERGAWRLASPVALAAEAVGEPAEGRFVRLHGVGAASGGLVPAAGRALVAALDSCVAAMLDRLGAAADLRTRLEAGKLGYLLLPPAEVARLSGAPTVGVANLQQDVVVTSHPCHAHELAHLVVNAWLRQAPAFMLPLLQEGVAVHLGGRWGRHPRVLERVGRAAIDAGWVALDDLLEREAFGGLPADLSYAPAGVFAGHLLDTFGAEGLRRACLAASGTLPEVAGWGSDAIRQRLADALTSDWDTIAEGFARRAAGPAGTGLSAGLTGPLPVTATETCGDGHCFTIAAGGTAVDIVFTAAPGGPAEGALLFGGSDAPAGPNALFAEHFPGRSWQGQTHGLLVSPDEARLYDYRLQTLVALHAEGFWPDPAWRDPRTGAFAMHIDRALWPVGSVAACGR